MTGLLQKIKPSVESARKQENESTGGDLVQRVAESNVQATVALIIQKSSVLREMIRNGEIGIAGGMYDIESGQVIFFPGRGI